MVVLITPEQFMPRALPVGNNDPTGMVYCPQRWSSIAILRCDEYQHNFGCGFACEKAVTPAQVKAVIAQSKREVETEDAAVTPIRGRRCIDCGKSAMFRVKSEEPRCGRCYRAAYYRKNHC